MRVLVIGATGTIGSAVCEALVPRHEPVRAGHSRGDVNVDLASTDSIAALFDATGPVHAVVCAAGQAPFGTFDALTEEDFRSGLLHKVLGQVNVVRLGAAQVGDGGSFTLTSGAFARSPMPGSAAIATANGAVESFARAAALEMPRGVRVNAVSPVFVRETMEAMGMNGASGLSAADTAKAYVAALEGGANGEVLDVRDFA